MPRPAREQLLQQRVQLAPRQQARPLPPAPPPQPQPSLFSRASASAMPESEHQPRLRQEPGPEQEPTLGEASSPMCESAQQQRWQAEERQALLNAACD